MFEVQITCKKVPDHNNVNYAHIRNLSIVTTCSEQYPCWFQYGSGLNIQLTSELTEDQCAQLWAGETVVTDIGDHWLEYFYMSYHPKVKAYQESQRNRLASLMQTVAGM